MSDVIKIAITGQLRAGKSVAEDHLRINYRFETDDFGGMLKYYADKVFMHTPQFQGEGKPRELYQAFGQKLREIDPDIWVRHLAFGVEVKENDRRTKGIVVTGLRQPNEYEWLRDNGFKILRITAPMEVRKERSRVEGDLSTDEAFNHETESHLMDFDVDYEISNDGSLAELREKVDDIAADLGAVKERDL